MSRTVLLLVSIAMLALSTILYGCQQTSAPPEENRNVAAKKPEKVVVNEGLSKEEEEELSQRLEDLENKVEEEDEAGPQEQQYAAAEASLSADLAEADVVEAAEDYYQAVDQENWAYTYSNLDSQTKALFAEDEWYLKNQYFSDTEGLELSAMDVTLNGSPTEVPVSLTIYRTFKDGSSISRQTYFVREGGTWKHRFTPEEIEIFMPGVPFENFVARQGGSTSSASATATSSAPSEDLDCSDFATQAEAQATLEQDLTDPHRLDADGNLLACEDLPGGEQYGTHDVSPNLDDPDGDEPRRPRSSFNAAPRPSHKDIDCDEVDGPIPTPPGDPDHLDGDGDGLACE